MEIHQCIDGEKGLKMICVIPKKDQPYLTCEG
jgi:hypothetical protein